MTSCNGGMECVNGSMAECNVMECANGSVAEWNVMECANGSVAEWNARTEVWRNGGMEL